MNQNAVCRFRFPVLLYKFWNPEKSLKNTLDCIRLINNDDWNYDQLKSTKRRLLRQELYITLTIQFLKIVQFFIVFIFVESTFWRVLHNDNSLFLGVPKLIIINFVIMLIQSGIIIQRLYLIPKEWTDRSKLPMISTNLIYAILYNKYNLYFQRLEPDSTYSKTICKNIKILQLFLQYFYTMIGIN